MTWTHAICRRCWHKREPDKIPYRLTEPELETCCFCGEETRAGIYVRHDPSQLTCTHQDE